MLSLAGVVAIVALLAGCTPTDPVVTPRPEPSATPLFASEDEALAAATEAYAAYLAMSDQITSEGGANPERIKPFVSDELLENEIEGYSIYSERHLKTVGRTLFDGVRFQQFDSEGRVIIYLCSDAAGIRLIDESGTDVTPASRLDRQGFEVEFEGSGGESALVVARSEPWPGSGLC